MKIKLITGNPQEINNIGFCLYIQHNEETILFDIGGNPELTMERIKSNGIDIEHLKHIVISHLHNDHIVGLPMILREAKNALVYLERIPEMLWNISMRYTNVDGYYIAPEIYLTTDIGKCDERFLIIGDTLFTACGHAGILTILHEMQHHYDKPIKHIVGGLHLTDYTPAKTKLLAEVLQEKGIEKVSLCHCTGQAQIEIFEEVYKENYIELE